MKGFFKNVLVQLAMVILVIALCLSYLIISNGGVKQIIIDTGKEIKEIAREIDES